MSVKNMRDNVSLVATLLEGLKFPDGIQLVESENPLFLCPSLGTPGAPHRAEYMVYLFKLLPSGKIAVRTVSLGFLAFAERTSADGLDWALTLVRKVEDAARLLAAEIERGEADEIEDGGVLPLPKEGR